MHPDGYTIVSGLAEGIDTAAMKSAIASDGNTIGVIGTPLNRAYPKGNEALQENVATNHLLISQVPFYRYQHEHYKARRYYFPQRNATMAALSVSTIIV
ncbi:MAG: DNA-processing protein DprA, partial [Gemmatimonadetes bacterium]|nr:DNA-processing protein DprA [Gemmatimonadota bacterium]